MSRRKGGDIQRETMQRDICARTISRQLAEEEPASQFLVDMASDRLQRQSASLSRLTSLFRNSTPPPAHA